jgi:hypothetical protein
MKFDNGSAFGPVDIVVSNAGLQHVAPPPPRHKDGPAAGRAAAMVAFAAGFLVAALGARAADEPARPRPAAERAGTDSARAQPTAEQFAPPNQPDISADDARTVDTLYRQLIGAPPATSSGSRSAPRLPTAPSDNAAGSVRRWTSPR